MPVTMKSLSLADAKRVIAAGEAKADELKIPYNISVLDAGGNLLAHVRMDGAWLGSIDIAMGKAWTARAFDVSTADLAGMVGPDKPLFGVNTTNQGKIVAFGGGLPIKSGNAVIGAVGTSGGSNDQDVAVAQAAVEAFAA